MHTILLIDDDERLAELLSEYFSRYDLQLLSETHPMQGIERLKAQRDEIDFVLLDIMLPDMDGFDVCRNIRKTSDIPILMLTARGDVMDRIVGLEIGADDYLAKPFEPRELVARINSILKRFANDGNDANENKQESHQLSWGSLTVDKQTHQANINQQGLNLSTKEFALLLLLAENPDKTYSRDEIMNELSGIDAELFSRSIDILVSRLRQKLKPLTCLQTVHGRGYRFIPPNESV